MVVLEDHRGEGSRRAKRIKLLLDAIAALVRRLFAADRAVTKYQIATAIAEGIPELTPRLPGVRKIWLPEHANMSIFDAASLVLTYFAAQEPASKTALAA